MPLGVNFDILNSRPIKIRFTIINVVYFPGDMNTCISVQFYPVEMLTNWQLFCLLSGKMALMFLIFFLLLFSKNINYNKDSIPLRSIIEKTADIILTLEVLIQH